MNNKLTSIVSILLVLGAGAGFLQGDLFVPTMLIILAIAMNVYKGYYQNTQ